MKHILNNLSTKEKTRILEQYGGGMKVQTEKFGKLINNKLGSLRPLTEDTEDSSESVATNDIINLADQMLLSLNVDGCPKFKKGKGPTNSVTYFVDFDKSTLNQKSSPFVGVSILFQVNLLQINLLNPDEAGGCFSEIVVDTRKFKKRVSAKEARIVSKDKSNPVYSLISDVVDFYKAICGTTPEPLTIPLLMKLFEEKGWKFSV